MKVAIKLAGRARLARRNVQLPVILLLKSLLYTLVRGRLPLLLLLKERTRFFLPSVFLSSLLELNPFKMAAKETERLCVRACVCAREGRDLDFVASLLVPFPSSYFQHYALEPPFLSFLSSAGALYSINLCALLALIPRRERGERRDRGGRMKPRRKSLPPFALIRGIILNQAKRRHQSWLLCSAWLGWL